MTTELRPPEPGTDPPTPEPGEGAGGTRRGRLGAWGAVAEWAVVLVGAVLLASIVKIFLVQAFYIPSQSMEPTLLVGDRVLVNKLSYHLHDVNRGDVIVFERDPDVNSPDQTRDLIKRVIALPGENIAFDNGNVYINGSQLAEPYLPPGTTTLQGSTQCTLQVPCHVADHTVFVMGDNRGNSHDSRFIGTIPEGDIVGRAFVRVWPFNRFSGL